MLCTYGSDFYYNHTFAKKDRANIVNEDLTESLIDYCAADGQFLLFLHDCEMSRAKHTIHREKGKEVSYLEAFKKIVLYQHSNNNHCYAEMEHVGSYCDVKYLIGLQSEDSVISKQIKDSIKEIYSTKYVAKANDILLKEKGVDQTKTLFKAPFVFKINDTKHKELLFFKILKLEPVDFSKKTGKPSLGKSFKEEHKGNNVVKLFTALDKANKIKSTYVTAFIKALSTADGKTGFLHANFGFFDVLTGRANSSKPSFQQIPEHGDLAKIIKRIFIAPKGQLIVKLDYSAHENRCVAIAASDDVLASVFQTGRDLRKKFHLTSILKYIKEIFYKGDVHKLNAERFFKVAIENVADALRQATKAIIFGIVYGSSAKSIAVKLQSNELDSLNEQIKSIDLEIKTLEKQLESSL